MNQDIPVNEVFLEIGEYAYRQGARSIKDLPGCWEAHVDKHWWIAINAHTKEMKTSTGIPVPACSAYVEFNGWPAAVVNAAGGWIAAGEIANENEFLKVLKGDA